MNWKTVQQIIRIIGFAVAGVLFGMGLVDQDTFMKLIGGGGFAGLFTWWGIFNSSIRMKRPYED